MRDNETQFQVTRVALPTEACRSTRPIGHAVSLNIVEVCIDTYGRLIIYETLQPDVPLFSKLGK